MLNSDRTLTIIAGNFPARSETFIEAHVCGMARRGWRVQALAQAAGEDMSEQELSAIDDLSVERSYTGEWSSSRFMRSNQMIGDVLRDPSALRYLNGKDEWTRSETLSARRMYNYLSRSRSHIYHIHFGKYAALLSLVGWDRPTIVTWHGFDANELPKSRGNDIYKKLFERDWTHSVGSEFMRNRLIELGARKKSIVKVPMGIDFKRFNFIDRTIRPPGPLRVISVGRLDEMKGHRYLIEAISQLQKAGVEIQTTIIGDGPCRNDIEKQLHELNLNSTVEVLGAQPASRVAEELSRADVFALTGVCSSTGRVETQGMVYIEAQGTGLPVIVADVGGVSESLQDGKTGMLVPPEDVDAIASAVEAYAQNRSLRLTHGKAGSEFVHKKFDIDDMLNSFISLYAS